MILTTSVIRKPTKSKDEFNYKALIFKINLSGNIDKLDSVNFSIFLKTLINGGGMKILLDMSELEMIDSKGIGKIIAMVKLVRSQSGEMVLVNDSQFIKEIFISLNMQEFLKVFASEPEALKFLLSLRP